MKDKVNTTIKKIVFHIITTVILLVFSCGIAYLISTLFQISLRTVVVYEGFFLVLMGALLSPGGSRTVINLGAFGQKNAAQISYQDLEVNRLEQEKVRESKSYYKDFFYSLKASTGNLTLILTGAVLILYSLNYME